MAAPDPQTPPYRRSRAPRQRSGAGAPGIAAAGWARFSLLNDEPVSREDDDVLGAGESAFRLSSLLRSSHGSTPFTLAVDAGWGMGKSSLMRLVDASLSGRPEIRTVWYNAWTASGGDALEGLIKSVLISLDPNVLRRGLRRMREQGRAVRAVRALATLAAGLLHAAGPINELWERMSADPRTRNEMRDVLCGLVADWADAPPGGRPRRMLVVFIDDLDRCPEETVLAVCEALKLYLDVPGIAFVIGCDRSALAPHGLLRDLSPAASAFLEKIFHTSYRVPVAADRHITAYVRGCAEAAGIGPFLDEDLIRLLVERSSRNPRRIKRLVNGFVLEATLNPVWQDFGSRAVIRVLLLQYLYADFYRMMTTPRAPAERDVITEFRDYRLVRHLVGDPAGEGREQVAEVLRHYELPLPPTAPLDPAVVAALERELPLGFPELAADRGFTSLLDELLALDEAERLVRQLRHAPPPVVATAEPEPAEPLPGPGWDYPQPRAADPDDEDPYGPLVPAAGRRAAYPRHADAGGEEPPATRGAAQRAGHPRDSRSADPVEPYAGLDVLWIDDHPESVRPDAAGLTVLGAAVRLADGDEAADLAIAERTPGLLISDIVRGAERNAGIAYVRRLRDTGAYTGPVVFFTSQETPARLEQARELGALGVAVYFSQIRDLIDAYLRRPDDPPLSAPRASAVPSAPRVPRYDDPPR